MGTNGPWVKQPFVIESHGDRFPKKICFIAWNERAEQVAQLPLQTEVRIAFDLESRQYQGRWYTDARAWKIEIESPATPSDFTQEAPTALPVDDDLPF